MTLVDGTVQGTGSAVAPGPEPGRVVAPAPRLRRPSWRDRRLLVGLALLLASTALGARAVAEADRTRPVYAARVALPTGTALRADLLRVVRVRLTGTAAYLEADHPPAPGQVLVRTVGVGEIVPAAAVAPAAPTQLRPVGIPLDDRPPAGLGIGGRVDVWASARRRDTAGGGFASPTRIAESVEVFGVHRAEPGLAAAGGQVQVLLTGTQLVPVLDALANGARVVILPVPGVAVAVAGDGRP